MSQTKLSFLKYLGVRIEFGGMSDRKLTPIFWVQSFFVFFLDDAQMYDMRIPVCFYCKYLPHGERGELQQL